MKKLFAIMLSLCMVMSVLVVPAFATGETVIDATQDVVSYYDNGMNSGNGSMETLNGDLMLRQCGEWVTYDISELTAGTYSVSVSYRSTAQVVWKAIGLDFSVDGDLELRSYLSATGEAWSDAAASAEAGKIYVAEGAKELKVKNHGMYPINLDTITLTYVGAEDTTEDIKIFGQNATTSPNETKTAAVHYLGVDYWDAATSTTDKSYNVPDEDGNLHLPFTNGKILETTKLVQHAGDWARYDISELKAGTYELTINRAHKVNATYGVKIDGSDALSATIEKTADTYGVYADATLGKIYISDENEYLILENQGSGSVYVDYMSFKYLSEERDEETYPSISISATNVIPGGQGVGYYGNTVNNGAETLETSGANIVLRGAGEWAAYDVSGLEKGIYSLSMSYTVRETTGFHIDVYVDGELQAKTTPAKTTNSLGGTPDTIVLCDIEIKDDSSVLKIVNPSSCVTFIQGYALDYKEDKRSSAYTIRNYGDQATRSDISGTITYTSGEDFYDAGGKAFTACLENGILAQNPSDWARYDISGLKQGTYKVTLNHANIATAQMKFKVDGKILLLSDIAPTNTSYGTYQDDVAGYMYIEEGAKYLILENVGAGSLYPKYFDLELVSEKQTSWPSLRIKANKAIAFTDTSGNDALELSGESAIVFRAGESVTYDATELKKGTYSLSIANASTSACRVKVSVDEKVKLMVPTIETGGYSTYEDNYLGSVYIGEDTQTITIDNAGTAATYMSAIVFDYISENDESVLNLNINSADVYQPDGYIEEGVSYLDGGGEGKFELTSGDVVLRADDWVAYDADSLGLEEGIYSVFVTAKATSASTLAVEAEGTNRAKTKILATTEDVATECEIGKLIVGESSNYFKISNGSTVRVILGNIRITNAEESTVVSFSSDENGLTAVESLEGLTSAYANVSIIRPEEAETIGETVYVAVYEGNKLVSVSLDTASSSFEFEKSYLIEEISENTKVKVFVWDVNNAPVWGETEISAK